MIVVPTAAWAHTPFDLAAWASGSALGAALYRWRLRETLARIAGTVGPGYFIALALGAVAGGWLVGSVNTLAMARPALSHSIVGALAGAVVAVEVYKAVRGARGSTGVLYTGSFALGVAVGRFGCLFAGLPDRTYGAPSALPFAVDLGDGVPRHPVQVYESLAMALFLAAFVAGLRVRADWAMRRGFYAMCAWYGAQRFLWEFLKPYPKVFGPLNVFQPICLGLVIYGCVFYLRDLRDQGRAQERALPVPGTDHEPV